MIEVTILEGQYNDTPTGRTYHTVVGKGSNQRSYKRATAAAWKEFHRNDMYGTPLVRTFTICVNGKVVCERTL